MAVRCPYCYKIIQNRGALRMHIIMSHEYKCRKKPPLSDNIIQNDHTKKADDYYNDYEDE